jgi:LemA protein
MTETVVTLGIVLLIVLLALMASYNGLTDLRQQVRSAWGDIDSQLKRRYALLATLVNIVQSAGAAQATGLSVVVTAKHKAAVAFNPPDLAKAEAELTDAMHAVFNAADSEPSLKSDPVFDELRARLLAGEQLIDQNRSRYNDRVLTYNAAMAGFPYNLTAAILGFSPQPLFDVSGKQ